MKYRGIRITTLLLGAATAQRSGREQGNGAPGSNFRVELRGHGSCNENTGEIESLLN